MPRTIQGILDHADDLAKRFEEYEPTKNAERTVAEYLLQRAALMRARRTPNRRSRRNRRAEEISWARIGALLGTSAKAAQLPYGNATESVSELKYQFAGE
jgi:hypothetical protein